MSDRTWTLEDIDGKMEWEGMPDAIEWIHWEDIEDGELAALWSAMEAAYLDYDKYYGQVEAYLREHRKW